MSYWLVDRFLPGLSSGVTMAAVMWVSHLLLRRHITRVAREQTEHFDTVTAEQTKTLASPAARPRRRFPGRKK